MDNPGNRYLTLIDTEGVLAAIIPFEGPESAYEDLVGQKLGCSALCDSDRKRLLSAYGAALVEQHRQTLVYRWREDNGETHLKVDVLRFPKMEVSALLLSKVLPAVGKSRLTERETNILRMSAEDCTDAEIAKQLGIAKTTVARHKQNIRTKIGVKEWAAAVARAIHYGWI